MTLLKLFTAFFQVGLFSFGGGYAILEMIRQLIVEGHGWLTLTEYIDMITLSQMTPGPIALNAATFVGTRMAGVSGAIMATLGCVFPSIIIVLTIAYFYFKYQNLSAIQGILTGLRPTVAAMIASAGMSVLASMLFGGTTDSFFTADIANFDVIACFLFIVGLIVIRKWKLSPIYIMVGCGVLGLVFYSIPI